MKTNKNILRNKSIFVLLYKYFFFKWHQNHVNKILDYNYIYNSIRNLISYIPRIRRTDGHNDEKKALMELSNEFGQPNNVYS